VSIPAYLLLYVADPSRREITVPFWEEKVSFNSWIGVGAVALYLLGESRHRHVIDHIVHRGGFVAGVVMGYILRILGPSPESKVVKETEDISEDEDSRRATT
jgi:hypothetical protein